MVNFKCWFNVLGGSFSGSAVDVANEPNERAHLYMGKRSPVSRSVVKPQFES